MFSKQKQRGTFLYTLLAGLDRIMLQLEKLKPRRRLYVPYEVKQSLEEELQQQLNHSSTPLTPEQGNLISEIRQKTNQANRDNISRTEAYLNFYKEHPEVHWALLAHMVSRNGGYHMTDLKTHWLASILDKHQQESFFIFLERCNWLIFQDAYPQLLLYAHCKSEGEDRMSLLVSFGVSRFMISIWKWFLNQRQKEGTRNELFCSKLLTFALIQNEQNYIEKRVIRHHYYQEQVLNTWKFTAQSLFHLNHVIFPYKKEGVDHPYVGGLAVTRFDSLEKRIEVGKSLYHLLFDEDEISQNIQAWAIKQGHTASRADYWPELFSFKESEKRNQEHFILSFQGLHEAGHKVYSPFLKTVWPVVQHLPAEQLEDWCQSTKALHTLWSDGREYIINFSDEHLRALNEIELISNLKP